MLPFLEPDTILDTIDGVALGRSDALDASVEDADAPRGHAKK